MSEIKLPEPAINNMGTDGWSWWPVEGYTADQMRAAILEERERCAKICENGVRGWNDDRDEAMEDCAAAIRGK